MYLLYNIITRCVVITVYNNLTCLCHATTIINLNTAETTYRLTRASLRAMWSTIAHVFAYYDAIIILHIIIYIVIIYYGGGYACDSEPAATWQRVVMRRRRCVWPGAELKNAERVHRVRRGLSSSSRRFLAAHFHPARPPTIANHVRSLPTPPRGLIIFFLFGGA